VYLKLSYFVQIISTRMWADAQCDGRPAEYMWHPVLSVIAEIWLTAVE